MLSILNDVFPRHAVAPHLYMPPKGETPDPSSFLGGVILMPLSFTEGFSRFISGASCRDPFALEQEAERPHWVEIRAAAEEIGGVAKEDTMTMKASCAEPVYVPEQGPWGMRLTRLDARGPTSIKRYETMTVNRDKCVCVIQPTIDAIADGEKLVLMLPVDPWWRGSLTKVSPRDIHVLLSPSPLLEGRAGRPLASWVLRVTKDALEAPSC